MAEKITHSICVGGPLTIHTTEDGVIRRVRPIVFDETDPAGWVIKARGKEFTPQRKTTLSLLGFTEKDRAYSYDRIKYPMIREDFVETPDGAGTVSSVNLLRQTVQVRLDSAPETPKCYHNCELCVIRSGKGKRPEGYVEPPLEELAKLRKPQEPEETPDLKGSASPLAAALEAVFNGETPQYEGVGEPAQEAPRSRDRRRSRRSRGGRSHGDGEGREAAQSRESAPAKEKKPPRADKPREVRERPAGEAKPPREGGEKRSSRPHRRRRPRGGGGGKPQSGGES